MKKLVTISLFIFWAAVTAILVAGLVIYQNSKSNTSAAANQVLVSSGETNSNTGLILNSAEVSKHNLARDCWLIISNKVYNVTSYLGFHPGGAGAIIPYCGKDASQAFATKDIGRPHSNNAVNLLNDYFIGNLNQEIPSSQLQQNVQKTNSVAPSRLGESEREREDD